MNFNMLKEISDNIFLAMNNVKEDLLFDEVHDTKTYDSLIHTEKEYYDNRFDLSLNIFKDLNNKLMLID